MPTLLIVYNTKTGNTELMAKAVEKGARTVMGVDVIATYHANLQQLKDADGVIIGAPTYNHHMTFDIQQLLEKASKDESSLKGKIGATFGSFGWSGEAPNQVLEVLKNRFQMKIIESPIRAKYKPDEKTLKACIELGKQVAEALL